MLQMYWPLQTDFVRKSVMFDNWVKSETAMMFLEAGALDIAFSSYWLLFEPMATTRKSIPCSWAVRACMIVSVTLLEVLSVNRTTMLRTLDRWPNWVEKSSSRTVCIAADVLDDPPLGKNKTKSCCVIYLTLFVETVATQNSLQILNTRWKLFMHKYADTQNWLYMVSASCYLLNQSKFIANF